jgi:hypothetical protein
MIAAEDGLGRVSNSQSDAQQDSGTLNDRKRAAAAREAQTAPGAKTVYEYATLRVVPSIERGEAMNVGVVLYCQRRDFLGCRTRVDPDRLRALAADLDLEGVRHALHAVDATCGGGAAGTPAGTPAGTADALAGTLAASSLGERFRWLTAPRSTIVQPGPVHPGLTDDPAAELGRLFDLLVG